MFNTLLDKAFERAEQNGDLDNLPGSGKPIEKSKLNADPFAHVYGESDAMTPFGAIQRQIDALRPELAKLTAPAEIKALEAQISQLESRKAIEMEIWKRYS